jgi:hypothetical protein
MDDKFTYNVPKEEEEEDGGKSEHQAIYLSAMKGIDIEEIPYKLCSENMAALSNT